jgi:hypothetical protein
LVSKTARLKRSAKWSKKEGRKLVKPSKIQFLIQRPVFGGLYAKNCKNGVFLLAADNLWIDSDQIGPINLIAVLPTILNEVVLFFSLMRGLPDFDLNSHAGSAS